MVRPRGLHTGMDLVSLFCVNLLVRWREWRATKETEEIGWLWKRVR